MIKFKDKKVILVLLLSIAIIISSFLIFMIYNANQTSEVKMPTSKERTKDLRILSEGENIEDQYEKTILLSEGYGGDVGFGILDITGESPSDQNYAIPTCIGVGSDGNIYISNPVKKNIKVFTAGGKYLDTIDFAGREESNAYAFLHDMGVDKYNNVFFKSEAHSYEGKIFKTTLANKELDLLAGYLEKHWYFKVMPDGKVASFDSIGWNRFLLIDAAGNALKESSQQRTYYEDYYGNEIIRDEDFIYSVHIPEGYESVDSIYIGCDKQGNMYWERVIDTNEPRPKTNEKVEHWVDIINISEQTIKTFRLDRSSVNENGNACVYNWGFGFNNRTCVDEFGNIYQLNANSRVVSVTKYESINNFGGNL